MTESMHRDDLKVAHETQRIIMDPVWHDRIYGLRGEGANDFLNLLQEVRLHLSARRPPSISL